jgi:hypothetical protein
MGVNEKIKKDIKGWFFISRFSWSRDIKVLK